MVWASATYEVVLVNQAWRLMDNPDSLCARLLRSKYYPNGNLLDTVFSGNSSAVWKGIKHGLQLVKREVIWRAGDGTSITTCRDSWIPRGPSFRPIIPKHNCHFNSVSIFLDENGAWNVQRLNEYFWTMDVAKY